MTTTVEGRCFVSFPSVEGPGIQVAELAEDGTMRPYPDEGWNAVRDNHDPAGAFVGVNGLRIGPDGHLWIVDSGAPGLGQPRVPHGPRLIVVSLATDEVIDVYQLDGQTGQHSYIDDIRFNGDLVYLTDAGEPGLLVLDRGTGQLRRALDHHPATVARRPMRADGRIERDPHGDEVRVHADQLEVSPDGEYLYFQPASGPMSRIGTRWLDDPDLPAGSLAGRVERWLDTPTTGGTAIDADGVIYLGDVERRRILRLWPDRRVDTLVADPRLVSTDALWIGDDGFLWIPAAQLNRSAGMAGGRQAIQYPIIIYKLRVDAAPPANDHS
ncbi:L-dopachrome tautomerase-related protein [Rugosimonospora acidiphila]|uniref:L-dopachrome tautomerase-related protein n=1 Tax=Rugosimonospora acidiphila TaxID=556531 RepID=UPI0031E4FE83